MQNKQRSSNNPILLALGGTGGHLFPALSLAHALKEKGENNLFFAGSGLLKNPFFEKEVFSYKELKASTPFSKKPLAAARSLLSLSQGILQALFLVHFLQPKLVIGFGSFHAFPVMMAARIKKIPYLLFEPNLFLGKANQFFAKKARALILQFEQAGKGISVPSALLEFPIVPRGPAPAREEALKAYGLSADLKTLLILGGSQGARFLNDALPEIELPCPFQVIHLTGAGADLNAIEKKWSRRGVKNFVVSFEKKMEQIFAAADIAICRSGGGTLSELIAFGVPALLIPYPFAYEHQMKNAQMFAELGGGAVLTQKEATKEHLNHQISSLLTHCQEMKQKLQVFKIEGSRRPFVEIVLEELGKL